MKTAVHIHATQSHSGGPVAIRCEVTQDGVVSGKWTATVRADDLSGLTSTHGHRLFGLVKGRLALDAAQGELW